MQQHQDINNQDGEILSATNASEGKDSKYKVDSLLCSNKDLFIKNRTRTVVKLQLILYEFFRNNSLLYQRGTNYNYYYYIVYFSLIG
jgi:hypothetical protein